MRGCRACCRAARIRRLVSTGLSALGSSTAGTSSQPRRSHAGWRDRRACDDGQGCWARHRPKPRNPETEPSPSRMGAAFSSISVTTHPQRVDPIEAMPREARVRRDRPSKARTRLLADRPDSITSRPIHRPAPSPMMVARSDDRDANRPSASELENEAGRQAVGGSIRCLVLDGASTSPEDAPWPDTDPSTVAPMPRVPHSRATGARASGSVATKARDRPKPPQPERFAERDHEDEGIMIAERQPPAGTGDASSRPGPGNRSLSSGSRRGR